MIVPKSDAAQRNRKMQNTWRIVYAAIVMHVYTNKYNKGTLESFNQTQTRSPSEVAYMSPIAYKMKLALYLNSEFSV